MIDAHDALPLDLARARRALASATDLPSRLALGCVLQVMTEHEEAMAILRPVVEEARATGEAAREVAGLVALGVCEQLTGVDPTATYTAAITRATESLGEAHPLTARAVWEHASMLADAAMIERSAAIWDATGRAIDRGWAERARAMAIEPTDRSAARDGYLRALAILTSELGENHALLIDVLGEAAAVHRALDEPADAAALRVRTVAVARASCGAGSLCHAAALYAIALVDPEDGTARFDAALAEMAGDPLAEAIVLYAYASGIAAHDPARALDLRERSLDRREDALGVDHDALPILCAELGRAIAEHAGPDAAERYWRRRRARLPTTSTRYLQVTEWIASLLRDDTRRGDYVTVWRELVAARDDADALDAAVAALLWRTEAAEVIALAERAVAARESSASLRNLARAYLTATRPDDAYRTWQRAIDHWIAAIEALPPGDTVPYDASAVEYANEKSDRTIFDETIARATAIAGADNVGLARIYLERARFNLYREGNVEHDLQRAIVLFERAGDRDGIADSYRCLGEHHVYAKAYAEAEPAYRRTIDSRDPSDGRDDDLSKLAGVLEQLGGDARFAEALAIRTDIIRRWREREDRLSVFEEHLLVKHHLLRGDLAAATVAAEALADTDRAIEYVRTQIAEVWWDVAVAKFSAGDSTGTEAALDAMLAGWSHADTERTIHHLVNAARWGNANPIHPLARAKLAAHANRVIGPPSALEVELHETPDDLALRLVLADELTAKGDPRGELIVVHHRATTDPALASRATELVQRHPTSLLGPCEESQVRWHLGYFERATLVIDGIDDVARLRELPQHRSAWLVREVRIAIANRDPSVVDATIAATGALRAIPAVTLFNVTDDELARVREHVPQAVSQGDYAYDG
ncbi:MAG: hypothetical protein ACXVEF_41265 [Polyangiales bacterium]